MLSLLGKPMHDEIRWSHCFFGLETRTPPPTHSNIETNYCLTIWRVLRGNLFIFECICRIGVCLNQRNNMPICLANLSDYHEREIFITACMHIWIHKRKYKILLNYHRAQFSLIIVSTRVWPESLQQRKISMACYPFIVLYFCYTNTQNVTFKIAWWVYRCALQWLMKIFFYLGNIMAFKHFEQ